MKLLELLINQKIIIQLLWGEQKIEFYSEVLENDESSVYVAPYIHRGSALELNVTPGKGVICNLFTDDPVTNKRISWKNVELTTVIRNNKTVYALKTYGFNYVSKNDDRRLHERIIIKVSGQVFDGHSENGINIVVHDISDIGISFFAPKSFSPISQQLVVTFTDKVDEKFYDVKVDCSISRTSIKEEKMLVGCKIIGENRDYQLYGFIKRLKEKNKNKNVEAEISTDNQSVDNSQPEPQNNQENVGNNVENKE